jgi:hypothetical protein
MVNAALNLGGVNRRAVSLLILSGATAPKFWNDAAADRS